MSAVTDGVDGDCCRAEFGADVMSSGSAAGMPTALSLGAGALSLTGWSPPRRPPTSEFARDALPARGGPPRDPGFDGPASAPPVVPLDGSAYTGGIATSAAPTPSATASAPTRPTQVIESEKACAIFMVHIQQLVERRHARGSNSV